MIPVRHQSHLRTMANAGAVRASWDLLLRTLSSPMVSVSFIGTERRLPLSQASFRIHPACCWKAPTRQRTLNPRRSRFGSYQPYMSARSLTYLLGFASRHAQRPSSQADRLSESRSFEEPNKSAIAASGVGAILARGCPLGGRPWR
jgi:hypothetical protein